MNKKDTVIAVLATFCLTATLFMIFPTRSNPGIGEYDPWVDTNGDGTVDIYDAISLANAFNTAGDPTKDVNVVNWPSSLGVNVQNWPICPPFMTIHVESLMTEVAYVPCPGFSRMEIMLEPVDVAVDKECSIEFRVSGIEWCASDYGTVGPSQFELVPSGYLNITIVASPFMWGYTRNDNFFITDTKTVGCYLYCEYKVPAGVTLSELQVGAWIYLRNE